MWEGDGGLDWVCGRGLTGYVLPMETLGGLSSLVWLGEEG